MVWLTVGSEYPLDSALIFFVALRAMLSACAHITNLNVLVLAVFKVEALGCSDGIPVPSGQNTFRDFTERLR